MYAEVAGQECIQRGRITDKESCKTVDDFEKRLITTVSEDIFGVCVSNKFAAIISPCVKVLEWCSAK